MCRERFSEVAAWEVERFGFAASKPQIKIAVLRVSTVETTCICAACKSIAVQIQAIHYRVHFQKVGMVMPVVMLDICWSFLI